MDWSPDDCLGFHHESWQDMTVVIIPLPSNATLDYLYLSIIFTNHDVLGEVYLFPLSRCVLRYPWHRWICGGVFVRSGTPHTRLSGTEMGPDISTIKPSCWDTVPYGQNYSVRDSGYCMLLLSHRSHGALPTTEYHSSIFLNTSYHTYRRIAFKAIGAPGPSRPTRLWKPHWTTMHALMTCCKINTFAMNHCGRKSRYWLDKNILSFGEMSSISHKL